MGATAPFAYVFERFPSFTQTFCVREVRELERQGMEPRIFSIHDTTGDVLRESLGNWANKVETLPQGEDLVDEIKRLKKNGELSKEAVLTLRHWGERPDKRRVYEALWIGHRLRDTGIRHVHSHFAGIGARACWWLRQFFDITYSFTGHANDLFCPDPHEIDRDRLMRDAGVVVTVSDFTLRHIRQHHPQAKARRVYNGLDLAPITAAAEARPAKESPPLIVSVGRLIEKKGFADLIAACALLREGGHDFRCEIIGEGPLESDLLERIQTAGLETHVTLAGPKAFAEIIDRLSAASIFALACAVEQDGGMDNLPTVIMEAMAARLPCVSTRLAGVPEMVAEDETGLLCDPGDVAALAQCLRQLLDYPDDRARFGEAGLARARTLFAKEVTARELRHALVGGGLVGWRAAWLLDSPNLITALTRQTALRLLRLLGITRPRRQLPQGEQTSRPPSESG